MRMIILGSTLLLCSNTCSFLYINHITEANQMIEKLAQSLKKGGTSSTRISKTEISKLQYFIVEHTKMVVVMRTVGKELWSRVLLICFAVHVPSNVYLLYRLLQAHSFIGTQIAISLTFLMLQFVILSASILPLATSSTVFHRSSKVLTRVQLGIGASFLNYKLKLNEFYERVNSEDRYGLTVGATGTITYSYLFQVFWNIFSFLKKIILIFVFLYL